MTKHFAIYKKHNTTYIHDGYEGSILVQIVPEYFNSLEEAETYIRDPKNNLLGIQLTLIEEHSIYCLQS